jgi:hypothetical protein
MNTGTEILNNILANQVDSVTHNHNPRYSEARDPENHTLRPAQTKCITKNLAQTIS